MSVSRTPEQESRETIDRMLELANWSVQDFKKANIHAKRGVAIRNFPLNPGHGFADYICKFTWSEKNLAGKQEAYDFDEPISRDKASLDIF